MIKTIREGDNVFTKQYQYVIEIAETGNFSKAAENLFIAQSSLSQYIKKLEKELGIILFDRTKQPVTVTEAGKSYLNIAYEILFLEKQLQSQIESYQPRKKKKIVLGITRYWGSLLLPRILPDFHKKYPGVNLDMREGKTKELIEWLENKQVDIAFFTPFQNEVQIFPCYDQSFILREEIQLAISPSLFNEYQLSSQSLTLDQLVKLPILSLKRGQKLRGFLDQLYLDHQTRPKIVMETENITTAYKLSSVGIGVTLIPERILELTSPFTNVLHLSFEKPIYWELNAFTLTETKEDDVTEYLMMLAKKAFLA